MTFRKIMLCIWVLHKFIFVLHCKNYMQQQKVEDQNTIHLMFRPVNFNYSDRITVVYIQQIGLVNRE